MAKFSTLGSKDIAQLLQSGRRYRSRSLLMFVTPAHCEAASSTQGKVALIAPKRLGNAVLRNRCKRLLRAGFERSRKNAEISTICDNSSIIFMATPKTSEQSSVQIAEEITRLLTEFSNEVTHKDRSD